MTMVWIVLTAYFVQAKHDCVLRLKKSLNCENFPNVRMSVTATVCQCQSRITKSPSLKSFLAV